MPNLAPGVYVTVSAAPPSANAGSPTGQWFVTGYTNQGPTGVAVPITSMTDYANYLGTRTTNSSLIYDSLDEYFHDGGVFAWVSRVVGPSSSKASVIVSDQGGSPQHTLTFTTVGSGVWGNAISIVVAAGTAANSYTLSIQNAGVAVATSPNLFFPADAVTWIGAQNPWQVLVSVVNDGSSNATPTNNPANGTYPLTGGTDDYADITDTQFTAALTYFTSALGPGQVSAPGHTTNTGYLALAAHALAFNRTALLDVADNASASNLETQAASVQSAATNPSYAAMCAPWVIIPGITSTNPSASSPVPTRTIPPSALFAAMMSANDLTNDANNPAAGSNGGTSGYAIGVTQTYVASDLGNLNAAGVDVVRIVNGTVQVYGYRSLALDPNWVYLNNCRFRMQVTNDMDLIGEGFVFAEIDGKGQVFARLAGALSGKCQQYWTNNSIFGPTAASAFQVNVGPQVNTNATIAAGQINAIVSLKMSPYGEFVDINVLKYLVTANLPS